MQVRSRIDTPWHPSLTVTHSLSLVPLPNHIPSLLYLSLVCSGVSKSYVQFYCSREQTSLTFSPQTPHVCAVAGTINESPAIQTGVE
jgi:hypothetical protein